MLLPQTTQRDLLFRKLFETYCMPQLQLRIGVQLSRSFKNSWTRGRSVWAKHNRGRVVTSLLL